MPVDAYYRTRKGIEIDRETYEKICQLSPIDREWREVWDELDPYRPLPGFPAALHQTSAKYCDDDRIVGTTFTHSNCQEGWIIFVGAPNVEMGAQFLDYLTKNFDQRAFRPSVPMWDEGDYADRISELMTCPVYHQCDEFVQSAGSKKSDAIGLDYKSEILLRDIVWRKASCLSS